jgi:hypothetical protein
MAKQTGRDAGAQERSISDQVSAQAALEEPPWAPPVVLHRGDTSGRTAAGQAARPALRAYKVNRRDPEASSLGLDVHVAATGAYQALCLGAAQLGVVPADCFAVPA